MSELTLATLAQITHGRVRLGERCCAAPSAIDIGQIATDSRHVLRGDLFWALPGERFDGARFVSDALARGAAGAVTEQRGTPVPGDRWILEVDDSLAALTRLASWRRDQFAGQVVAITGSVGKSTTREMLSAILRQQRLGTASPRSFNNQIGLPLSMLELEPRLDYAVFELGASQRGEIARLAELCRPHIGIITTIGDAHFGGFGGYEAIAAAKCELLTRLAPGGLAILNSDCERLRRAASAWCGRKLTFGRGPEADIRATRVEYSAGRLTFHVGADSFDVAAWGRHQLVAALAAVAGARALGIATRAIQAGFAAFEPLAHRSLVRRVGEITLIDDCYNASPTSVQAALALLRETPAVGRKIAVLGDMLELGAASSAFHRLIGDLVVTQAGADRLIACGAHAGEIAAAAESAGLRPECIRHCSAVEDAWHALRTLVEPGDAVLVKASRAVGLDRLVAAVEAEAGFRATSSNPSAHAESTTSPDVTRTCGAPSLALSLREFSATHPPG